MAQAEGKLEILNSAYYEQIISISKKKTVQGKLYCKIQGTNSKTKLSKNKIREFTYPD